jgi:hypothetical protein
MTSLLRRELSDAERGLTELQLWALSAGASCWIIDLEPYEPCRVAGMIERLTVDPVAGHMDASVTDGTDRVIARWAIRRPAPQTACIPGRFVVIEGLPCTGDEHLMILEPQFEVVDSLQVA